MSWVTVVWSMLIGGCIAIALPQLLIWMWQRRIVHLLFVILVAAKVALLWNELVLMHASSVDEFSQAVQWRQLPLFVMFAATIVFVRFYFDAGRWWLGIAAGGVRFACLVINFAFPPNLYFREITSLRPAPLLSDTVLTPIGIASDWSYLTDLSSLLLLAFLLDASIRLWRKGKPEARRRALTIGGSILLSGALAAALGTVVHLRSMPALAYLVNLPFVLPVAAMAFELSYDLFAALHVAKKLELSQALLRESEARFRIVADSAPVLIWMSGPDKRCTFFNKGWLEFTGRTLDQELGDGWTKGVHVEDLPHCLDVYQSAFDKREPFTIEYRLRRKDGDYRWLLDTGTPRFDTDGAFLGYIGSCIDIGDRKQVELDHQLQSMELARVGRLALMGELAASLAHEVNNPLGAMVTNASAGQRLLSHGQLHPDELRELLADIVADGQRAREVVQGIRNMVRKTEASHSLVDMKDVIRDLLRIVRADATVRKISLVAEVDAKPGIVMANPVQLLQVFLNLTMNAFEALSVIRADARRVVIRAERVQNGKICVSVRDAGPGFPDGVTDQLFEPFFSTKAEGTGMGLAIARSIVEAHGGTLSAKNCADGGALFTICLPEATEAKSRAA